MADHSHAREGQESNGFPGVILMSPVLECLREMDAAGISWVSWKNNHEIALCLDGKSDLDIYVPRHHSKDMQSVFLKNGWVRLDNVFQKFPWVYHYYLVGQSGKIYHLHVYSKVVTGESAIKEYVLPLDDYLISNRIKGDYGVWILNPEAQAYVFAVRHLLKGAGIASRYRYSKELDSYRKEAAELPLNVAFDGAEKPISLCGFYGASGLKEKEISLPKLAASLKFRFLCYPYLRGGLLSPHLRRIRFQFFRVINRVFLRRKKVFLDGGVVVAVTGADGSGKSTMLEGSYQALGRFISVKKFHIGKPLPRIIDRFISLLSSFNKGKNGSNAVAYSDHKTSKASSVSLAIISSLVAFFRMRMAIRCQAYARNGFLVLVDRWPTSELGKMDGPRIRISERSGWAVRWLMAFERWAYSRMPRADLCIRFRVSLPVAIERNQKRSIVEDEEYLIKRHLENSENTPLASSIVDFNNDGDRDVQLAVFLSFLWGLLRDRQS